MTPAAASALVISGPSSVDRDDGFSITVSAFDAYLNYATGYTGTVHFTSTDRNASLPANFTFNAADAGTYTFTVALKRLGEQTITATDTLTSSITGSLSVTVYFDGPEIRDSGSTSLTLPKGFPSESLITGSSFSRGILLGVSQPRITQQFITIGLAPPDFTWSLLPSRKRGRE